ncbi:TPA: hypothetical protein ACN732_005528, partial [Klebsiella pneumoniae]
DDVPELHMHPSTSERRASPYPFFSCSAAFSPNEALVVLVRSLFFPIAGDFSQQLTYYGRMLAEIYFHVWR